MHVLSALCSLDLTVCSTLSLSLSLSCALHVTAVVLAFLAFIFLMWWCQYRADHKDRMEMVEMANIRAMNAYEAKRSYGTNA